MSSGALAFAAIVFLILMIAAYIIGLYDGCRIERDKLRKKKLQAIRNAVRSQLDPAYPPEAWKG